MGFWGQVWARLKAVPVGLWAALGVALAIMGMYLRGRRLEAELARSQVQLAGAKARKDAAGHRAAAEVHTKAADEHAERVKTLEKTRMELKKISETERKRLVALPPDKTHEEYLKLAQRRAVRRPGAR